MKTTTEITLTEDQCFAKNIDFTEELNKLIKAGYDVVYEYVHPAVGKVVVLKDFSK